MTSKRLV